MDPPEPAEPSLFMLPVLTGHIDNFNAIPKRVRELVRYRGSVAGPWLFDPAEHTCSLWEWVARTGFGDSCRDARILDEFVEAVFAYHPETGTLGVALWRPSIRSMLTADSVIGNQVMSCVSVHLAEPRLVAAMRTPRIKGHEPEIDYAGNPAPRMGGGVVLALDELARIAYGTALKPPFASALGKMGIEFESQGPPPQPSESLLLADWLELLLRDPYARSPITEYSVPESEEDLCERLAEVHEKVFELDTEEHPESWEFVMTLDALFARVIDRTNELRRLYRRHAEHWPQIPPLRLPYPTAHVTFCVSTPELARLAAEMPCEHCEGCEKESDLTLFNQMRLDLAS